jgi:hypothetical protein
LPATSPSTYQESVLHGCGIDSYLDFQVTVMMVAPQSADTGNVDQLP